MSWKEFISDEGEGSGSCVTLAIPVKLQILFFFSLLAFEPERRKKVQWELFTKVFLFTIFCRGNKGKISSVFVRIHDRRNLVCFLLWEKHKYYKSGDLYGFMQQKYDVKQSWWIYRCCIPVWISFLWADSQFWTAGWFNSGRSFLNFLYLKKEIKVSLSSAWHVGLLALGKNCNQSILP